jgi:hypothetical protein
VCAKHRAYETVAPRMQTKFSLYLFYYVSSTRDVEARAGEFDRGEKRAKLHGNPTVRNEPSYVISEPADRPTPRLDGLGAQGRLRVRRLCAKHRAHKSRRVQNANQIFSLSVLLCFFYAAS